MPDVPLKNFSFLGTKSGGVGVVITGDLRTDWAVNDTDRVNRVRGISGECGDELKFEV